MDFVRKKPSVFPTSVLLALCLGFIGGLLFGYCLYLTATLNVPSPELTDTRLSTSKVVYGSIKCPDVPPSVPCEPCVGTVANQTIGCPEVPTCETCEASGNGSGSQQDMAEDEVFVKNLPQNFIHKTTDYHRKNMTKMPYQVSVQKSSTDLRILRTHSFRLHRPASVIGFSLKTAGAYCA